MRSESLRCHHRDAHGPGRVRTDVTLHAHLTALPGLLAEADLAEAHVEARDRRTGALVAYSFVTIHRALALHVAEAVRVGLARLDLEAGRDEPGHDSRRIARGPWTPRRRRTPIIARASTSDGRRRMGPPKRRGSRRRPRSRHTRGARGPRPELAIVVRGGVVQGVYANRCGPLTVYLLDYDDLRADDDLAEARRANRRAAAGRGRGRTGARRSRVPRPGHPPGTRRQAETSRTMPTPIARCVECHQPARGARRCPDCRQPGASNAATAGTRARPGGPARRADRRDAARLVALSRGAHPPGRFGARVA